MRNVVVGFDDTFKAYFVNSIESKWDVMDGEKFYLRGSIFFSNMKP